MRFVLMLLVCLSPWILAGCSGSGPAVRIDPDMELTVEFCDPSWNGDGIPTRGRCSDCGGEGPSPALRIGGLTDRVDAVVVEFNDLRILELRENGGHGAIGMDTDGQEEIILPSVREETMKLPRGVRCVHPHRCVQFGHKGGAYKAPCGCGYGNPYAATVLAIDREGDREFVVARTVIRLGSF